MKTNKLKDIEKLSLTDEEKQSYYNLYQLPGVKETQMKYVSKADSHPATSTPMAYLKEENQNKDGTWNVTWDWTDYPQQWSIAKNWWHSDIIINNLKYLKKFGKASFPLLHFTDNMLS